MVVEAPAGSRECFLCVFFVNLEYTCREPAAWSSSDGAASGAAAGAAVSSSPAPVLACAFASSSDLVMPAEVEEKRVRTHRLTRQPQHGRCQTGNDHFSIGSVLVCICAIVRLDDARSNRSKKALSCATSQNNTWKTS